MPKNYQLTAAVGTNTGQMAPSQIRPGDKEKQIKKLRDAANHVQSFEALISEQDETLLTTARKPLNSRSYATNVLPTPRVSVGHQSLLKNQALQRTTMTHR
jgi:hypothetical protein